MINLTARSETILTTHKWTKKTWPCCKIKIKQYPSFQLNLQRDNEQNTNIYIKCYLRDIGAVWGSAQRSEGALSLVQSSMAHEKRPSKWSSVPNYSGAVVEMELSIKKKIKKNPCNTQAKHCCDAMRIKVTRLEQKKWNIWAVGSCVKVSCAQMIQY